MTAASGQIEGAPRGAAIFAYAIGSFGTGVFSTVPTVLLLYYCTQVLRLDAAVAALIVFIPKVWAVVWDPLVGAWSDRAHGRFGRRRPFLAVGALGVAAAFVALFAAPLGGPSAAWWVGGAYFALATLYSLFAVPYIAIPAEIGRDAAVRSRLVSWRMTCAMVGVLAGAAVAPALVEAFGGGVEGYRHMALVLAVVCGLAMLTPLAMLGAHDGARARQVGSAPQLGRLLLRPLARPRFVWLAVAYLLQLTAVGALSAAAPYLITQTLHRPEGDISLGLGLLILSTIVAIPIWAALGRRYGERLVLALGALAYGAAASLLAWAALQDWPWGQVLVLFALAGAPFAAAQVLPFVLMAHLAHAGASGADSDEGVLTGAWTATEKLGLAMGPALIGLVIARAGGDPSTAAPGFLGWGPLILMILSLGPLYLSSPRMDSAR